MKFSCRPVMLSATAALVLAACASTSSTPSSSGPTATPDPLSSSITVFAASSLTATFNSAETAIEAAHPGFMALYSFGSSQALVTQIINSAPADVIATANASTMQRLVAAGLVETPQAFCKNKLEIIVAPGNPKGLMGLPDLAKSGLSVVLADPSVPVGGYAAKALSTAGIKLTPKSLQSDDAQVVNQVESGNADAGIVFVTDVATAGSKVTGVPIPDAQNVSATYEIAALKGSSHLAPAEAFVTEVVSGSIHAVLLSAGFLAP